MRVLLNTEAIEAMKAASRRAGNIPDLHEVPSGHEGLYYLDLDRDVFDAIRARSAKGESYSDTIVRVCGGEAQHG